MSRLTHRVTQSLRVVTGNVQVAVAAVKVSCSCSWSFIAIECIWFFGHVVSGHLFFFFKKCDAKIKTMSETCLDMVSTQKFRTCPPLRRVRNFWVRDMSRHVLDMLPSILQKNPDHVQKRRLNKNQIHSNGRFFFFKKERVLFKKERV